MLTFSLPAIVGQTASGKTQVGVELAKLVDGEIISCDSRQVYKYLDIGTNKEGILVKNLRFIDNIPQYLTDIIKPDEIYSAGNFLKDATSIIEKIKKKNKVPIIVAGTGLYLKSLINGLAPLPQKNENIRQKLYKKTKIELYSELKKIDPIAANKIHPNNIQRIIRALEVYYLTGFPISYFHSSSPSFKKGTKYKILQFGLLWNKQKLRERIKKRIEKMLNSGLIEETKKVLKLGYDESCPAFQSIGYKQILLYIKNVISYEEMKEKIFFDTWQYAKRQLTWFRKDKTINWIKISDDFSPQNIAYKIKDFISG